MVREGMLVKIAQLLVLQSLPSNEPLRSYLLTQQVKGFALLSSQAIHGRSLFSAALTSYTES